MSIQSELDQQAINLLSKVSQAIADANKFESNQMRCYALRAINNTRSCLADKTESEINTFDTNLIKLFKEKNWIN
jgi:hypothetical protein